MTRVMCRRGGLLVALAALLSAAAANAAPELLARHCAGEPLLVTTLGDEDDAEGCANGACSLREAVALGNACPAASALVIRLAPGVYRLRRTGFAHSLGRAGGPRARGVSALIVAGRLRIEAEGAGATILREPGAGVFRLFEVAEGANLTLVGVALRGGDGGAHEGGGVHVRRGGALTLERAALIRNAARLGGGLYVAGAARLRDSVVRSNRGDRGGGVFAAPAGRLRIERSRIEANIAIGHAGVGGGVETLAETEIRDTEFARNRARYGAALSVSKPGRLKIDGGRIEDNDADETSAALELLTEDAVEASAFSGNRPRDRIGIGFERPRP